MTTNFFSKYECNSANKKGVSEFQNDFKKKFSKSRSNLCEQIAIKMWFLSFESINYFQKFSRRQGSLFSKKKLINLTKFCQLPIYKLLQILKNWQSSKSRNANFLSKLSYFQQKNSSLFSSIKKYYRSQNIVNFWFPLLENYHPIFDHPDKQKKITHLFFFHFLQNIKKLTKNFDFHALKRYRRLNWGSCSSICCRRNCCLPCLRRGEAGAEAGKI